MLPSKKNLYMGEFPSLRDKLGSVISEDDYGAESVPITEEEKVNLEENFKEYLQSKDVSVNTNINGINTYIIGEEVFKASVDPRYDESRESDYLLQIKATEGLYEDLKEIVEETLGSEAVRKE